MKVRKLMIEISPNPLRAEGDGEAPGNRCRQMVKQGGVHAGPVAFRRCVTVVRSADQTIMEGEGGDGEVNGDTQITLTDAIMALQITAGLTYPSRCYPGGLDHICSRCE
jgi:hypothetical protein